ncbi:SMI1/KNR4 family protein [Chryseobacterium sp. SSA4.19]|uniref:SMI1/KNR4 family protein n=1 Tax=Chryseobacterium sp. SSA4.19 TaxID=2919915 RepID=UPI001F4E6663|nr:SMI1/KNR4 family protein [Chryseobacterium sp. SSA4.19]MCJ8155185.1 SMI1/KNR4 family protein [Chryseobacterium sp. SSA4.19]
MNPIAQQYIAGLKKAYYENNGKEIWEHFEKIKHGLTEANIEKLTELYPDIPDALISLLNYVDGTYWREYEGEKIAFYLLGSDMEEYPYYLLSSGEMIENRDAAVKSYSDYIEREYEEVEIDEKITDTAKDLKWLHFSDCMNNGGTSQLFIDFSPSAKGIKGQIVRFLHDPDELIVIADSFEEYLETMMDKEYDFIQEDMLE